MTYICNCPSIARFNCWSNQWPRISKQIWMSQYLCPQKHARQSQNLTDQFRLKFKLILVVPKISLRQKNVWRKHTWNVNFRNVGNKLKEIIEEWSREAQEDHVKRYQFLIPKNQMSWLRNSVARERSNNQSMQKFLKSVVYFCFSCHETQD